MRWYNYIALGLLVGFASNVSAHERDTPHHDVQNQAKGEARYIANEGVMVASGGMKILFDPLALSGFDVYPEISAEDKAALMAGEGEFKDIDWVFISHAHTDHFSAPDMMSYMAEQSHVKVVMPQQALDKLREMEGWDVGLEDRISALDLDYGHEAVSIIKESRLQVDAVRIPHAGWPAPKRAAIQNMVYRVTLINDDKGEGVTVMHMGDADPRAQHFIPYNDLWDTKDTDLAMPPYWFVTRPEGKAILKDILHANEAIGIHVPINKPLELFSSGADFFSIAGETREIGKNAP